VKVLVTGAGGFLGRNLAESLCQQYEVIAPSRVELNLMDEDAVHEYLEHHRFDTVIHAASVRANRRIGAPPSLMQSNCRMFFNLARNSERFGKLLFLSSGAVYDRRGPIERISETSFDARVPADPFGFSKYICAHHIAQSANLFELRLFGVFGPHEDWEIRFLSNACCRAVWDLPVTLKQNVRFDYLDVADLAKIVPWFIESRPRHRAYNVCTGRAVDLTALARKVVHASGKNLPVEVGSPGLGNEYSGDNRRLLAELPNFRFRALDDSIHALYRWYREHKQTIDPEKLHFDAPPPTPAAATR
jgi:UDP-glucose 4-epimerase